MASSQRCQLTACAGKMLSESVPAKRSVWLWVVSGHVRSGRASVVPAEPPLRGTERYRRQVMATAAAPPRARSEAPRLAEVVNGGVLHGWDCAPKRHRLLFGDTSGNSGPGGSLGPMTKVLRLRAAHEFCSFASSVAHVPKYIGYVINGALRRGPRAGMSEARVLRANVAPPSRTRPMISVVGVPETSLKSRRCHVRHHWEVPPTLRGVALGAQDF